MPSLHKIIQKLNGRLSEKKAVEFEAWLQKSEGNLRVFTFLKTLKEMGHDLTCILEIDIKAAWNSVLKKASPKKRVLLIRLHSSFYSRTKYIAAAVVIVAGFVYFFHLKNEATQEIETELPNANEITLQTDIGKTKVIPQQTQKIKDRKGQTLGIQKTGVLIYKKGKVKEEKMTYHTLQTPWGSRFQIILSDGTLVHLNAGTTLRYPVKFIKNKPRLVYLRGEAWFEVQKGNALPFVVTTDAITVEVSGTQFNVSTYIEDKTVSTVLVEGSVSLYGNNKKNKAEEVVVLSPGHRAVWNKKQNKIHVDSVDTSEYTAWRKGKLVFHNATFRTIVKKLERHYNVSIQNHYNFLNKQIFTASFDVENIEEVLDLFCEDTPFTYEINGRSIQITKP